MTQTRVRNRATQGTQSPTEARTPEKYGNALNTSRASDPTDAPSARSATPDVDSAASLQQEVLGFDSGLEVAHGRCDSSALTTRDRLPAHKRWGRGGRGPRRTLRTAPRPPALSWSMARSRAGSMTKWVSGVCPLASRDAGPRPAARLARSRCAAHSACSPRATSRGQDRSLTTTSDRATEHGWRVRVGFPS
jgi:hypothetical protein